MEMIAPMVMTPVPPMPATSRRYGRSSAAGAGAGSCAMSCCSRSWSALGAALFLGLPPMTDTKLGQKPSAQE